MSTKFLIERKYCMHYLISDTRFTKEKTIETDTNTHAPLQCHTAKAYYIEEKNIRRIDWITNKYFKTSSKEHIDVSNHFFPDR